MPSFSLAPNKNNTDRSKGANNANACLRIARANFYHHMYDCCKNETAHAIKFGWMCSKGSAHHTNASCKRNPSARRKYSIRCVESDWKCLIKESVQCIATVLTSSEKLRNKCHCTNAMKAGTGFVHSCRACTEALEMMLLRWHQCYNYTEDPCSQASETLSECTQDLSHIDEHDYKCVHNKFLAYACNSRILTEEDSVRLNKPSTIWLFVTLSVIGTILLSTLVGLVLYCCCCSQKGGKTWNSAKIWKGAENVWASCGRCCYG
ncbi:hypothetical protein Ddc_22538 [Ditylenchus destructor]|nr:hypothetical protein Ddc_22538 [Ditylenchus destructor]